MSDNYFESKEQDSRLLCKTCRKRLGVGKRCMEWIPVPGQSPRVAHVECQERRLLESTPTSTDPFTFETIPNPHYKPDADRRAK